MKKNILKSSVVGLSGLVLLSMTANSVSAATQGTVSYKEGATTAWSSPEAGQKVNSYLAKDQKVSIASEKQVFGDKWYKLDNGSWVAAKYISTGSEIAATPATTTSNNVTVNYADGAVTLWSAANSGVSNGKYVFNGDSLAVKSTKTVYNTTWYEVEGGWVSGEFVSTTGKAAATTNTTNNTVAKVATTTATTTQTAPKNETATTAAPKAAATTNNTNTNNSTNNNVVSNNNNTSSSNNNVTSGSKSAAISRAMSQIGKPYAWGASGPSAFDCSGLMVYAFGSSIGRTTYQQEYAGRQVSISSLQPGDMIFWGSRGSTYHVGLYIGNGQYVHAPKPGDHVRVASISSYFMPSFGVRV